MSLIGGAKIATRVLAFIGRELVEVARRPGALASLVFGPFLVMALFGLGYSGFRKPLPTLVVVPPQSGLPTDVQSYRELAGAGLEIVGVLPDASTAMARLESGEVDVVAEAPSDARQRFEQGQQSVIRVQIDINDPTQAAYAQAMVDAFDSAINREIIRRAAQQGEGQAQANNVPGAGRIPPEVLAAPTRAELGNVAPVVPSVIGYFAPAVLALVLQHMAVTLVSLSVVRERTSGVIELFRISPVSAFEIVLGKVIGYGALCAAIAIPSMALLVGALGVPSLGSPAVLAGVLALLVLASVGLGLLISIISDSERQAVQLSLLVLLASVFFSGFVLPTENFNQPVRGAAFAIPVTNGIRLIQDVMLRGEIREPWTAGLLAIIALVLLGLCWVLLRRAMSRA